MEACPYGNGLGGSMRVVLTALAFCCAAIAFVNFGAFLADCAHLGGSAGNGYEGDGRFFVGDRSGYTEVSEAQWRNNQTQGNSVFVTHLLGMAGIGYLLFTREFPAKMWRGTGPGRGESARAIAMDSLPLVSGRCGGRIGGRWFSTPLLAVAIYPAGVVIKPLFMPPIGLKLDELNAVRYDRISYIRGLRIDHSSPIVKKPISLFCREDDPIAANLRLLVQRSYHDQYRSI